MATEDIGEGGSVDEAGNFVPADKSDEEEHSEDTGVPFLYLWLFCLAVAGLLMLANLVHATRY